MKKFRWTRCWIYIELYLIFFSLSSIGESISKVINQTRRTPMQKILFTQRGYIQFLRWELPVPEIEEFTFCLWIKSHNLTLPHSIFSYSKNGEDRLVRSWIGSNGRDINLEIGEKKIFQISTDVVENRWYHLCVSWENVDGRYALWIDGRIKSQGYQGKRKGHVIPSEGDIVLGQEYTDFDKGLEEGIEGAVVGFNFLLASAFSPLANHNDLHTQTYGLFIPNEKTLVKSAKHPVYENSIPRAEGLTIKIKDDTEHRGLFIGIGKLKKHDSPPRDPLGLHLIKFSYVHCEIGRGSPFIGGPLMLISWTRTPVRVFGGAIIKNVPSNCGHFE